MERPPAPLHGYKLAYPLLSSDGTKAAFSGLSIGKRRPYDAVADATCSWNPRHAAPVRRCSCGFYCFHSIERARAMGCDTRYRTAVVLEVSVSGRYIRYEDGIRYARQRVGAVRVRDCRCGRPASALVDRGLGFAGWRRLVPSCVRCAGWGSAVTFPEYAAALGGWVDVVGDSGMDDPWGLTDDEPAKGAEVPFALVAAEVALLQARLDVLQSQLARLSDNNPLAG